MNFDQYLLVINSRSCQYLRFEKITSFSDGESSFREKQNNNNKKNDERVKKSEK